MEYICDRTVSAATAACVALFVVGSALLGATPVVAQNATWSAQVKAVTKHVVANSVAVDPNGNVYVGGTAAGVADFGGGPVSPPNNATDAYVVSYDRHGARRWVRPISGQDIQEVFAVAVANDGHVFVTGAYGGSMTLGNNVTGKGIVDIFLAKLDATTGTPLWVRSFGTVHEEKGRGIAVSGSRVCISGFTFLSIDLGGGLRTAPGGLDAFIACYDTQDGAPLWSRVVGGSALDNAFALAMDGAGSTYAAGRFGGSLTIGSTTLVSAGRSDAWVAKWDKDGSPLWAKRVLGHALDDVANAIAVRNGVVAVSGFTQPETPSNAPAALWLAYLATVDGSITHVAEFGSSEPGTASTATAVAISAAGDVSITGNIIGTVNFGGTPLTGTFSSDVFIATFSSVGAHQHSRRVVAPFLQSGQAIASTDGALVLAGNFVSTIDFGSGPIAAATASGGDVFVTWLAQGTLPVPGVPTATSTRTFTPTITPILPAPMTSTPTVTRTRTPTLTPPVVCVEATRTATPACSPGFVPQ